MKMLLSTKHIIALFVTGFSSIILYIFHKFVLVNIRHELRAKFMRAEAVFIMECGIGICSYILWRTLKSLPNKLLSHNVVVNSTKQLNRRSLWLKEKEHGTNSNKELNGEVNSSFNSSPSLGPKQPHLIWKTFLLLFIFMCHFSFMTNSLLLQFYPNSTEPDWFSYLTYLFLGILLQYTTGLIILNFVSFVLKWTKVYLTGTGTVRYRSSSEVKQKGIPPNVMITLAIIIYTVFATSWGIFKATKLPAVKSLSITLRNLPSELQDFRIIQLSDIHLGPTVGKTQLQNIVDIVNSLNGDVVVITGDLVDGSVLQLGEGIRPLGSMRSKYGSMYVTGNHEYYTGDVDNWFQVLQRLGVKVLHNTNFKVPPDASDSNQICFVGTDDLTADKFSYNSHGFRPADAVKGCERDQPIIHLTHQPTAALRAIDVDVGIDLTLVGHTHGGQIFPVNIAVYLCEPLFYGLYHYKGSQIYVSAGTQYWGIPMRIGAPMEINVITLKSS